MPAPHLPVLLTGASGRLGRVLARALCEQGWEMRLTDIVPLPLDSPPGASFTRAELGDEAAMLRLAEGCGTILHFGGVSGEAPFETVIGPNIRGLHSIYEAARAQGARMVFASSNHVVGFFERSDVLSADCPLRPDGYYGLSKAYGELIGRLYWDKHGVSSVFLRIGSCFEAPTDARMLATWLSHRDLVELVRASALARIEGCRIIWGASANAAMTWWGLDDREEIGWAPKDSADAFAAKLAEKRAGPIAERYQGGLYCETDYSRPAPSPVKMFED
ncbi:MAG: NAD-dependent epimerase/dehydratase family protein [Caulobacteraceae bacterium]